MVNVILLLLSDYMLEELQKDGLDNVHGEEAKVGWWGFCLDRQYKFKKKRENINFFWPLVK